MCENTHKSKGSHDFAESQIELIDRYWRAANYLSIGQIYLFDNPLLREPCEPNT